MAIIVNLDLMLAKRKMRSKYLAERVGITEANLSLLKSGKVRGVRFRTLERICTILQCQPGDILEYRQTGEAPAAAPIPASTAAPTPPQVPDLATQLNAELEVIREYRSTLRELAKR